MAKHRIKRQTKSRTKIKGTSQQPRCSVFRSNKHIFVQLIDDENSQTIISASDLNIKGTKKERAFAVGKEIAKKAQEAKISKIVFDRGRYAYHGGIKRVAEGAREGGLKF